MTTVNSTEQASADTELPPSALLRSVGLTKLYPGAARPALDGVGLTVNAGEMVAVMGPSGCGKSTLLHLLGGLDRPTAGEVWLGGRRVDQLSETGWALLRRRQVGFVFQFFNLVANLTVADNIELPALLAGLGPRAARSRREELSGQLGLDDVGGALPARLSGGQQQRVALARALVNRPTLLLADEPTGNLDSVATREVLGLLRTYHAGGQAILIVSHDPRVAAAADRVLAMRDGRIVDEAVLTGEHHVRDLLAGLLDTEDR
jgi:putative ABC transport system ATP-binding protein